MKTLVVLAALVVFAYADYHGGYNGPYDGPHGRPHGGRYGGPHGRPYGGRYNGPYGGPYHGHHGGGYGYYYKRCPKLPAPADGSVSLSGTRPGSIATYSCNRGFDLNGEESRRCQRNGEWSGDAPTCEKILCPELTPPQYGKIVLSGRCVDDYAVYRCTYGYRLSGKRRRVCQEDGTWSEPEPECVKRSYYGHGRPYGRRYGGQKYGGY